MIKTDELQKDHIVYENNIKNQVLNDLNAFAKEKNITTKELIKDISSANSISTRTLERIFEKKSIRPSNETLQKIYSYFYSTESLIDLILKTPEVIADSLKSEFMFFDKNSTDTKTNREIFNLTKDNIFNRIYFMTSGDFGTDLNTIRDEFGKYGLQIVDNLMFLGLVKIDKDDRLLRENTIFPTAEIRINLIKTLANLYDSSKNTTPGQNYSGIYMGDVTTEEFNEIHMYIKECFNNVGKKIANSRPTEYNSKKIVIGGIIEEIEFKKNGGVLC